METLRILATLAGIAAGAQFVHGQRDGLVCLDAESAERHGASDETLHDALYRFDFVYRNRIGLEAHEVADKYGFGLVVGQRSIFLIQCIIAFAAGELQGSDSLGVPRMADTVAAPVEAPLIGQQRILGAGKGTAVKGLGICGNLLESGASDGADLGAKIGAQQLFAEAHTLENLGTAVAADGTDTHLGHDLKKTFADRFDIILLCSGVIFLNLALFDKVVQDGEYHIRAKGRCAVAQQKRGVHGLTDLTALHYQGGLDAFAHRYQVVVHRRYRKQTRDCDMGLVHFTVGKYNVVVSLVHTPFCILAEFIDGSAHVAGECHRELDGIEPLIADVAQQIELCIVQYGMRQADHLAVALVGIEDSCPHAADVLFQAHHKTLANRVDGGVGDLRELLTEIIEEDLRLLGDDCQRGVITHGSGRLLGGRSHRNDGRCDILLAIAEHQLLDHQVLYRIVHMTTAVQLFELDAVGREPLAIRMFRCQGTLDFTVIIDFPLQGIYQENLTRLETSLLYHLRRIEIHDTHLRCDHHGVALGDGVASGTKSVAIKHTASKAAVREYQRRGAVPWLHQY